MDGLSREAYDLNNPACRSRVWHHFLRALADRRNIRWLFRSVWHDTVHHVTVK